ncbi:LacI family transcriptional regulator [Bifidobacterium minimum]|jgi:alanine racemase|uniref:LacI family transcriptional regulator n=1 Tax=Bifidobacterium minimum TaxID=1693 RepID=A0A087BMQ1_9BIFI|nr:LacI family DNA-binding transcriptional regulator [Bifidobacterium minimum]KFI72301.1 LacI family transcriptional regulator [Bifidobacterium minimum]MCH4159534.1 LacI family transcriptional regulator [Bifidobacterium minimum]
MTARLTELAQRTGVSITTISRVLNNKEGVADETRDKVLKALDEMGYERPRRLRKQSQGFVGIIVPDLDTPVFASFAQFMSGALARYDLIPVICTRNSAGLTEDDYVSTLLDRRVSGIIFVAGHHAESGSDPSRYQRLLENRLPIILVNGYIPNVKASFVSDDDETGTRLAVSHLASLGHTRIGLALGPRMLVPMLRREKTFRTLMRSRFGTPDDQILVESSLLSIEGGQSAAQSLIEQGCTGIICGSDAMAFGAIQEANRQGLGVPRDISIIGYDDSPLMRFVHPSLTTIRQSTLGISQAAVDFLVNAMRSGDLGSGKEMLFRPELVMRASAGNVQRRTPGARPYSPGKNPR